jgi:flagellar biosynthesis protein FlhB
VCILAAKKKKTKDKSFGHSTKLNKASSKKKKFDIKELLEYGLEILKSVVFPSLLNGLKDKLHHEVEYVTKKIEHKANKIIKNTVSQLIYMFMIVLALVFLVFGIYYVFVDILSLPRAFILLGLGLILIILVLILRPKLKTE